ncbi:MAG TPA: hypothetical protein VMT15_05585 [Bryobacteraceae bacterium]|nr:hypothetical protein [Bryobacteraceae bacterium]
MRFRFSGIVLGLACVATSASGQFVVNTVAGSYSSGPGFSGDGGAASSAQFNLPTGMAYFNGNLYITDTGNNVIRVISNGIINTYAGSQGSQGFGGDGAAANQAYLNHPSGLAVDGSGNLYIADTGNNVVRMVSAKTGNISTVAGNHSSGSFTGDGGVATNAVLNEPTAVAVDSSGNLYLTDSVYNLVRKVSASNQYISTVVGTGNTGGSLNHPNALLVDSSGAIYIGDTSHRVLKFANNALTTFAGTGDIGTSGDNGAANKALLNNPTGLAMDKAGNIYIVDANAFRVRMVSSSGVITTVAGSGHVGYAGDGGPALSAYFNFPNSICIDNSGNFYLSDTQNNVIRDLTITTPTIAANGVVSSASFLPKVAPGSLASIAGTGLATATTPEATPPLPSSLGGATVTVNGKTAPILYASPTLVNFQVPWETATGTASVVVNVAGIASNTMTVPVTATAPGVFFYSSGAAIAQNHDYSLNSPSNPAHSGSFLIAYLTGCGPVSPAVADGAATPSTGLVQTTYTPTVTIGGVNAPVIFSGLTPGLIALWQLDITVPSGLAAGSYPMIVTINGQSSNSATVSVAP